MAGRRRRAAGERVAVAKTRDRQSVSAKGASYVVQKDKKGSGSVTVVVHAPTGKTKSYVVSNSSASTIGKIMTTHSDALRRLAKK